MFPIVRSAQNQRAAPVSVYLHFLGILRILLSMTLKRISIYSIVIQTVPRKRQKLMETMRHAVEYSFSGCHSSVMRFVQRPLNANQVK